VIAGGHRLPRLGASRVDPICIGSPPHFPAKPDRQRAAKGQAGGRLPSVAVVVLLTLALVVTMCNRSRAALWSWGSSFSCCPKNALSGQQLDLEGSRLALPFDVAPGERKYFALTLMSARKRLQFALIFPAKVPAQFSRKVRTMDTYPVDGERLIVPALCIERVGADV
jgi:hypothetical protein